MDVFNKLGEILKPNKENLTVTISKDGQIKKIFENQPDDSAALGWMLRNQSNSTDHALRYEGWKVEVKDNNTGEIYNWKPYSRINQ